VDVEDARPNGCRKGVAEGEGPRGRDKGSGAGGVERGSPCWGCAAGCSEGQTEIRRQTSRERAAVGTQMNCIHVPLRDVRV